VILGALMSEKSCLKSHLIIGVDSTIGKKYASLLEKSGQRYYGTTRRQDKTTANIWHLDLEKDNSEWNPPDNTSAVILFASITSLESCRNNRELCWRINYDSIVSLAEKLVDQGLFVIFPSTNLVYDGTIPFRMSTDKPCPKTEYGNLKASVEKKLLSMGKAVSVVRMSKVLYPGFPLFKSWLSELKAGHNIFPFSDMVMSPVPINLVCMIFREIADRRLSGIFQISGSQDLSYADAINYLAKEKGYNTNLIHPQSYNNSGQEFEHIPQNTTLDMSRISNDLDIKTPDVWETLTLMYDTNERKMPHL